MKKIFCTLLVLLANYHSHAKPIDNLKISIGNNFIKNKANQEINTVGVASNKFPYVSLALSKEINDYFSVEAELSYYLLSCSNIKELSKSGTDINSELSSTSAFMNIVYSPFKYKFIKPYMFLGGGAERNSVSNIYTYEEPYTESEKIFGSTPYKPNSQVNMNFQLGTGVKLELSENLNADVQYKYRRKSKFKSGSTRNEMLQTHLFPTFDSHIVSVGIAFKL